MPPQIAIQLKPSLKWLNIVLDLNGVLSQCVERFVAARHGRTFCEDEHVYPSSIPTLVSPKGVYCCPHVREFLHSISKFATQVVIWSSMKRTIIEDIANFLFYDLSAPFAILGQSHCSNNEIGDSKFVLNFNENKLIFLKLLSP